MANLFAACLSACPKTNDLDFGFVQARQLHLQLFYSESERLFRVHERWLSVRGAIEELGLPDDLTEADTIFHTVKSLFADALCQLPRDVFVEAEDNSRTPEWRRRMEVIRAEQRLLNYLRMGDLTVDGIPGGLRVRWTLDYQQTVNSAVEVQCHLASHCNYRLGCVPTADQGSSSFAPFSSIFSVNHPQLTMFVAVSAREMSCIALPHDTPEDSEQHIDNDGSSDALIRTCRVRRYTTHAKGEHYEHDLNADEEYFFMLVMPTDPGSFVVVSSVVKVPPRETPPPPPPPPRSPSVEVVSSSSLGCTSNTNLTVPRPLMALGPRRSGPTHWITGQARNINGTDREEVHDGEGLSSRPSSPESDPDPDSGRPLPRKDAAGTSGTAFRAATAGNLPAASFGRIFLQCFVDRMTVTITNTVVGSPWTPASYSRHFQIRQGTMVQGQEL